MKTSSYWGKPPSRIYSFINKFNKDIDSVCIVGCSDGKFVFPFLRRGYNVTAIDIDKDALYGGNKIIPKYRSKIIKKKYIESTERPIYENLECEEVSILGLQERAKKEKLEDKLEIIEGDFYRSPPNKLFDVVFTSCSIQYKANRDMTIEYMLNVLKNHVNVNGYLYMDYMMPLEERHEWKDSHYLRNGQILKYFQEDWQIVYIKEMKKPVFEAAHIDRPQDHFHRFGYILARRMK